MLSQVLRVALGVVLLTSVFSCKHEGTSDVKEVIYNCSCSGTFSCSKSGRNGTVTSTPSQYTSTNACMTNLQGQLDSSDGCTVDRSNVTFDPANCARGSGSTPNAGGDSLKEGTRVTATVVNVGLESIQATYIDPRTGTKELLGVNCNVRISGCLELGNCPSYSIGQTFTATLKKVKCKDECIDWSHDEYCVIWKF